MEKDEAEQRLEKIVFGDDEGFRQNLKLVQKLERFHATDRLAADDPKSLEDAEGDDLELVDDSDVC